jgi:putative phosphoesterase
MPRRAPLIVGVLSDTHGLLRPEAVAALRGATHILHAGDIGTPEILEALRALAPVTAVRGNVDTGAWAWGLPETTEVRLGDARIYLLHDAHRLAFDPAEDGLDVVVSGHSHIARSERRGSVLHFNPGSAGPRRFDRPITLGRLRILGRRVEAEILTL